MDDGMLRDGSADCAQRETQDLQQELESELEHELRVLFPGVDDRKAWLLAWNDQLDGQTPQGLIEAGDADRVLRVVRSVLYVGIS